MTATVSITVAPLPENDIWFANAAAWTNYWSDMTADITIDAIATVTYVPDPYNATLAPHDVMIDSQQCIFPTWDQFVSLKEELQALNASYQLLRNELRNAGLITNAQ